jgi:hypothetical protein
MVVVVDEHVVLSHRAAMETLPGPMILVRVAPAMRNSLHRLGETGDVPEGVAAKPSPSSLSAFRFTGVNP